MRSTLATDVPPNFMTTTAIALPAVRLRFNCLEISPRRRGTRGGAAEPSAQTAWGEQESRLRGVLLTTSHPPRNIPCLDNLLSGRPYRGHGKQPELPGGSGAPRAQSRSDRGRTFRAPRRRIAWRPRAH